MALQTCVHCQMIEPAVAFATPRSQRCLNCKRRKANEDARVYYHRRKHDPLFRVQHVLRKRVYGAVVNCDKARKSTHTEALLGGTFEEVRRWIESTWQPGMSWENHGQKGWHIDHVRPCAMFDLRDPEQQRRCFHLTNLRAVWARDNLSKADTIIVGGKKVRGRHLRPAPPQLISWGSGPQTYCTPLQRTG